MYPIYLNIGFAYASNEKYHPVYSTMRKGSPFLRTALFMMLFLYKRNYYYIFISRYLFLLMVAER